MPPLGTRQTKARTGRKKARRARKKPYQKAKVESTPDSPAGSPTMPKETMDRIEKILEKATRDNANEAEVKAAISVVPKLITKYNAQPTDVKSQPADKPASGKTVVTIRPSTPGKRPLNESWPDTVAYAMVKFFDCNTYFDRDMTSVKRNFYGIPENTLTAAQAFAFAYNQIQDKDVLDRIQKAFARSKHENANESEAKAAIFVATRLMRLHNVTHADILANDTENNKEKYGGSSEVSITHTTPLKRVQHETFVKRVAGAMCIFFDCKCFSSERRTAIVYTFYGIAENTVAAAQGFEMAHNQILVWAGGYKGRSSTFSYRLGVADGLVAMAYQERKRELEEVRRKELDMVAAKEREEMEQRQRELERLESLPWNEDPESEEWGFPVGGFGGGVDMDVDMEEAGNHEEADFNEDDEKVIDLTGDIDENINRLIKTEEPERFNFADLPSTTVKSEKEMSSPAAVKKEEPAASPWASEMQLTKFRASSVQVAEDYIKEHKIKLRFRKPRQAVARDRETYKQGRKDSKDVEFR
ncbi:hypothetical protein BO78DRAFT_428231 [Aspergillus sclerotiicarbonarius CBS 121057]|uniref:DUF7168 domain-containing protein n=1 Tax=Aspergillus sclerotiicarbonarius (strain CBS 121057 / IBT 28362) TaxID=1448318 RepID=A0A319EDV8_ASPSB|nr:hypothetical protein BO78DRAFT_428231 [Aspergillus sclerotiicarbonarius CBS 121057]